MKKNVSVFTGYALVRAFVFLALGVLLIAQPESIIKALGVILGITLLLLGGTAIIFYIVKKRKQVEQTWLLPIVGALLIVLSVWLLLQPDLLGILLFVILGLLLVFFSIIDIWSIWVVSRRLPINMTTYILPMLVLLTGLLLIIKPFESAVLALRIFAGAAIVYGIFDAISYFSFRKYAKMIEEENAAENAVETTDSEVHKEE